MLIDWFTVIAQAANFLILVWLLKRFLYKPVLHAIAEREKRIAAQIQQAETRENEAQRQRDELQRQTEEIAQQRNALWNKASMDAEAERQRLIDDARKESDALRKKLREAVQSERDILNGEISSRAQQEVFAIARKTLSDLAAANLDERMAEVFIARLRGLEAQEKNALTWSVQTSRGPVLLRSAFDLPPPQRAAIERAIRETLGTPAQIQFETAPALIGGIELTTNGHKLAWSIADYLASLEKSIGEPLEGMHANGA